MRIFQAISSLFRAAPRALTGAAAAAVVAFPVIVGFEGHSNVAYKDVAGIWTICNGTTKGVKPGDVATNEECKAMTEKEVMEFAEAVDRSVDIEIPVKSHAAATSLAYNIGTGAWNSSTARRLFNEGDFKGGCQAFMRFVCITVANGKGDKSGQCKNSKLNKRRVQGLVNRREREMKLCLEGAAEYVVFK